MTAAASTAKVPQEDCDRRWRHARRNARWFVLLIAAVGLALPLYGLSESRHAANVGRQAEKVAEEVANELHVHEARQEEHQKHIRLTLDEMKANQGRIADKLDKVLEGK